MLLKTYELKALDCQLKATSAFAFKRRNLKEHYNFISVLSVKFYCCFIDCNGYVQRTTIVEEKMGLYYF